MREIAFVSCLLILVVPSGSLAAALWSFVIADAAWAAGTSWRSRVKVREPGSSIAARVSYLKEGMPIAAVSILLLANNRIDVPILTALRGPEETAAYWAAYNLLFAAMAFAGLLSRSALPSMALQVRDGMQSGVGAAFRLAMIGGLLGGCFALLLNACSGKLMGLLYGPRLSTGASALSILALALPMHFISSVLIHRLIAEGRQSMWTLAVGVAGGVNIALNLALDATLGIVGAATATVVSELCLMCVALWAFKTRVHLRALVLNVTWVCVAVVVCLGAIRLGGVGSTYLGLALGLSMFGVASVPLIIQRVPAPMKLRV
jgi:O-antigen/teichoic acid export membrane protein